MSLPSDLLLNADERFSRTNTGGETRIHFQTGRSAAPAEIGYSAARPIRRPKVVVTL